MKLHTFILSGVCLAALFSSPAQAVVTNIGYWRGGENDFPEAPQGSRFTVDIAGSNNLQPWNSPQSTLGYNEFGPYYSNTGLVTGSSYSYDFDPGAGNLFTGAAYGNSAFGGNNYNWGLQCYTTVSLDGSVLMTNGDATAGGFALFIYNGKYSALLNGVGILEGTVAANGTQRNVAVINDVGTVKLYIDGILDASAPIGGNNDAAGGQFTIGAAYNGNSFSYVNFVNGRIDEARIFTFNTGEFSASDLTNYVIPEPSTALLLMGAVGSLVAFRRRRTQP